VTARQLCLEGATAMGNAVGETWVHLVTTKVEVSLARMTHRPAADAFVQIEQASFLGHLSAGLGGHQAARRCWRDWSLLITGALAQEAARADRDNARLLGSGLHSGDRLTGDSSGSCCGTRRGGRCRSRTQRGGLSNACRSGSRLDRLNWRGFNLVRFYRRRPRFQPEPVRFADHCVAADPPQFFGDQAGGCAAFPHLGQRCDAFVSPAHAKSILSVAAHLSQACIRLGHPIVATP
jgi:hypothetical protein